MMGQWIKPESCESVACLQVKLMDDGERIALQDSKRPGRTTIVSKEDFARFLLSAKAGQYDDLVTGT